MLDHFNKEELPNPFAGTAIAPATKPFAPLVKSEPQTITVVPTAAPLAVQPAIRMPPPLSRLSSDRQVKHLLDSQPVMAQRPPGESDLFANMFTQISDMFATLFGEAVASAGRIGELLAEFFASLSSGIATGFLLSPTPRSTARPMPLATYAVTAKFGTMVFSRLESELFGVVAQGYTEKDGVREFVFSVPIKVWKISEGILKQMKIDYRRL